MNSLNWMAVLNGAEAALLVAACLAVHHRQALVYDFMTYDIEVMSLRDHGPHGIDFDRSVRRTRPWKPLWWR